MGVYTSEFEHVSPISAAKLFKAIILDGPTILPKALPGIVKSIEFIEGDGGPGTIRKHTSAQGSFITEIEAIDKEKYEFRYSVREGRKLGENLEKICNEYKMVQRKDGGCIVKKTTKHYTKHNQTLDEKYLKADDDATLASLKAVEDFLLANPDYN
ncbi:hypothetical protein Fmac_013436 [Flemingia macrophylla]|uniref:Bet v I/Major latex protein domain-containing protein n=1 Tax=Flemingia macrophylla TaxID=520843 RepID=A0ABD1MVE2_9FABA